MGKREWPAETARAKLLWIAAALIRDGYCESEARALVDEAMSPWRVCADENGFRGILSRVLSWQEPEVGRAVAEVYADTAPPNVAEDLRRAICAITVPSPHEDSETTHARLADAVRAIAAQDVPFGAVVDRIVSAIESAGHRWEASIANDRDALRAAAEAYFGGDFSKPEAT